MGQRRRSCAWARASATPQKADHRQFKSIISRRRRQPKPSQGLWRNQRDVMADCAIQLQEITLAEILDPYRVEGEHLPASLFLECHHQNAQERLRWLCQQPIPPETDDAASVAVCPLIGTPPVGWHRISRGTDSSNPAPSSGGSGELPIASAARSQRALQAFVLLAVDERLASLALRLHHRQI